jgi:hypothetical protein
MTQGAGLKLETDMSGTGCRPLNSLEGGPSRNRYSQFRMLIAVERENPFSKRNARIDAV